MELTVGENKKAGKRRSEWRGRGNIRASVMKMLSLRDDGQMDGRQMVDGRWNGWVNGQLDGRWVDEQIDDG